MQNITEKIWADALKRLEIRPHSRKELEQKLMEKHPHQEGVIIQTLDEMERLHLINEQQFIEAYVNHLTQKNIGMLKVISETNKKGLNRMKVEQALLDANWSEEASAKRAIEEKSRLLNGSDERKNKQKIMNFLRNRGFKDQLIYKLCN